LKVDEQKELRAKKKLSREEGENKEKRTSKVPQVSGKQRRLEREEKNGKGPRPKGHGQRRSSFFLHSGNVSTR